jgi:hypothetical protein
MLVRMRTQISGTRDGEAWPPVWGKIDLPDAEAWDMIRAELAEQADEAEPGQLPGRPPAQEVAAPAVPDAAEDGEPGEGDGADTGQGEPAETPEPEPAAAGTGTPAAAPGPSAPKQAWIDYAVNVHGADQATAAAMTKADLMSRYGGRL